MANCYDAETTNGIPYIARLYYSNFRYKEVVSDLDDLYPTKHEMLSEGTVKSYSIGSRSTSRQTLTSKQVMDLWNKLMETKMRLEEGVPLSRTLGVIPRDW